jgi:protein gp37
MAENTEISWTDATFNPWMGCTKVGPGCDHCYAENLMDTRHHKVMWGAGNPRVRTGVKNWNLPVRWNARPFYECTGCGWRGEKTKKGFEICATKDCFSMEFKPARRRVFCSSLADVFDNEVDPTWRDDLFSLIEATPNLDWLLLTKRIGNVKHQARPRWMQTKWPDNVWLGATIVNQEEADRDIPKLLAVPARVRFLSMEPLLGPVELEGHEYSLALGLGEGVDWLTGHTSQHSSIFGGSTAPWINRPDYDWPQDHKEPRVHWVIVGGESGHHARPLHPDWVRSLRDQCASTATPFHFKQWGEWVPYEHSSQAPYLHSQNGKEIDGHALPDFESEDGRAQKEWVCDFANQILARNVGKKAAGRLLDGKMHAEFPA